MKFGFWEKLAATVLFQRKSWMAVGSKRTVQIGRSSAGLNLTQAGFSFAGPGPRCGLDGESRAQAAVGMSFAGPK